MKSTIFFLLVIFTFSLSFTSCKTEAKPEISNTPFVSNNIPVACLFSENRRNGSSNQRINPMCADTLIRNYQRDVDAIKVLNSNIPNIDNLLTYGAQIQLDEMYTIIEKIEDGDYDEIYTMMAAVPGKASAIIFVLKNKTTNEKAYYNFTMPCPNACPETY